MKKKQPLADFKKLIKIKWVTLEEIKGDIFKEIKNGKREKKKKKSY